MVSPWPPQANAGESSWTRLNLQRSEEVTAQQPPHPSPSGPMPQTSTASGHRPIENFCSAPTTMACQWVTLVIEDHKRICAPWAHPGNAFALTDCHNLEVLMPSSVHPRLMQPGKSGLRATTRAALMMQTCGTCECQHSRFVALHRVRAVSNASRLGQFRGCRCEPLRSAQGKRRSAMFCWNTATNLPGFLNAKEWASVPPICPAPIRADLESSHFAAWVSGNQRSVGIWRLLALRPVYGKGKGLRGEAPKGQAGAPQAGMSSNAWPDVRPD